MIIIKIYQKKWQIHIGDEIWQFETEKDFQENLKKLLYIKGKYGRFNDKED